MKNAKLILIALLGALFISAGCGGSSDRSYDNQDALDAAEVLDKILTPGSDGAPVIFDYAPMPSRDLSLKSVKADDLEYVKYIRAEDLNSDSEFVTKLNLQKDLDYIIKYSHGGRA